MTTNSPNPVDGDVQALIERLNRLAEKLKWHNVGYAQDILKAVDLLTTPPAHLLRPVGQVHQVKIDDAWVDLSEGAMKSQLRHGATVRTLYAHPSGQVDLSNLQHKDDSWVHIGDVKKALRQQGYEVKND